METIELQQKTKIDEPHRYYSDENPAITGKIPEGYMDGKRFWQLIRNDINKFYKERGLLWTKRLR